MRFTRLLPLVLLFAGCASTGTLTGTTGVSAEGSTDDFDVSIVQANAAMVMRNQTRADVRFDITVANRTAEAYTIKRVTLQSMSGSTSFGIPIRVREFDKKIAPGAKGLLPFWAEAQVTEAGTPRVPVMMRASIEAVSADGIARTETFTAHINGRVQMQVANQFTTPSFMQKQQWILNPDYNTIVTGAYGLTW